MHSDVSAKGNLVLCGRRADLFGGQAVIGGSLWCRQLGSVAEVLTRVSLGIDPGILEEIAHTRQEIDRHELQLEDLRKKIRYLGSYRPRGGTMPEKADQALEQMKHDEEVAGTFFIHVTLIPFIKAAGEYKSKPTQHSVQELRRIGITPQMIIARSESDLPKSFKKKLALSCDVNQDSVILALDAPTVYAVPISFMQQNILAPIAKELELGELVPNMEQWDSLVKKIVSPTKRTVVGFVGKYLELKESYKSLIEALIHSGAHLDTKVEICWVDSEKIEEGGAASLLSDCDSILVAGGFGNRLDIDSCIAIGLLPDLPPERIEFIDAMPYTGAQKMDKKSLQEDIAEKLQKA